MNEFEMIELVEIAIYEACDYALPPHLLKKATRAAIEAIRQHFLRAAETSQFMEDRHALLVAAEELETNPVKVDA